MVVAHTDLPQAYVTAHSALFRTEFESAMALQGFRDFTTVTSLMGHDRQTYHWFGTPPTMVDVDHDEVPFDSLNKFSYTLEDKLWKTAIQVQRRALEDDNLDLIQPRIQQLAMVSARHQGDLVLEQLTATANGPTAYDGVALFSNSRTIGDSGTIDNILAPSASTPAAPTVAEFQAALAAARAQMAGFKDDKGRVQNVTPDTILYDPAIEQIVFQAMNGANTPGSVNLVVPAGQGGMTTMNGYKLFRNPKSDSAAEVYFLYTGGVARPFILQMRVQPTLEIQASANSDVAIEEDAFRYSVRARYNVGVGEPRHIIRSTFA